MRPGRSVDITVSYKDKEKFKTFPKQN